MINVDVFQPRQWLRRRVLLCCVVVFIAVPGCFDGINETPEPYRVGTVTYDPDLPPEPRLPTEDEVCSVLVASNKLVKRPDGALPPEADPSLPGASVAANPEYVNPDQERIQNALNECAALVNDEVGSEIAEADGDAYAAQVEAQQEMTLPKGATGEELAKAKYRGSKYAVKLVVNPDGPGDSFISGQLWLPSGVTLWIDKGVTLFGSRDVMSYLNGKENEYCGNTAVRGGPGKSSYCSSLINGAYIVNSAVVGEGSIDGRAYSEIISTDPLYPLIKVDETCSNTYDAWLLGEQAPEGTPCDNGGNFVKSSSTARNMTWWDLAYMGNMVQNGITGYGHQSNPRLMTFKYAKNLTLYKITLSNSPNFHVVPSGVDGLTIWGTKVLTPSTAAYANPAGNQNPLYTGEVFDHHNVKNTDAYDPASEKAPARQGLSLGRDLDAATVEEEFLFTEATHSFDGYLKNLAVAYNYISTGDDDIVIKGSKNPGPSLWGLPGVDGDRDARSDRKWGIMIAHNHIYWGHGISIGSETRSGVTNVHVYDNSFWGSEEALRIKSDYARGGEVSNVYYDNICVRNVENSLLFTTYYSTKETVGDQKEDLQIPNFHDIFVKNMWIEGHTNVRLEGYEANTGGFPEPAHPLIMTLENVTHTHPDEVNVRSSEARLTVESVNLPILPSPSKRVFVNGAASRAVDPAQFVDCSDAFVDFPSPYSPKGTTWSE